MVFQIKDGPAHIRDATPWRQNSIPYRRGWCCWFGPVEKQPTKHYKSAGSEGRAGVGQSA